MLKVLRNHNEVERFLAKLKARAGSVDASVLARTSAILEDVRKHGDAALLKYTRQFDGHGKIKLAQSEIKKHAALADPKAVAALRLSARRIKQYHLHQREATWSVPAGVPGSSLGQLIRPLERVGVYVPGGKAVYPSTVLMNVIPAQVAGVSEIAITVPAPKGHLDPHVMAAIDLVGIKEVYTVGGAQAVAALAYGTRTIRKVNKIVGPGNVYVATAKRMVFGEVDIDMIAGPSEVLIIADSSADPGFVAADLLSQAEHDELASSVLVTDSEGLALKVIEELKAQTAKLSRKEIILASLKNYGAAIIVRDMQEAAAISDRISPEHLEVMTRNPRKLLSRLHNAGAIFLGQWSPEPLGDYSAGPNHTLPTGATAAWASPLGVYDFLKRTSLLEFSREGFGALAPTVERIARCEGLEAHAESVSIRRRRLEGKTNTKNKGKGKGDSADA